MWLTCDINKSTSVAQVNKICCSDLGKILRTKFSCLVNSLLSRHGVAFNLNDITAPRG